MKINKLFISTIYFLFTVLVNLNSVSACEMEEDNGGCCNTTACCSGEENNCCASDQNGSVHAKDHLIVQNDKEIFLEDFLVGDATKVCCFKYYFKFDLLDSVEQPPPTSKKFIRFNRLLFYS